MTTEKSYLKIQCQNSKCKKVTVFSFPAEKCVCQECGTELPLKRGSQFSQIVKTAAVAGIIGFTVADAPEWLQTRDEIIRTYEIMNACMMNARNHKEQRDICACTFAKTYENPKWFQDPQKLFRENINKCYKS